MSSIGGSGASNVPPVTQSSAPADAGAKASAEAVADQASAVAMAAVDSLEAGRFEGTTTSGRGNSSSPPQPDGGGLMSGGALTHFGALVSRLAPPGTVGAKFSDDASAVQDSALIVAVAMTITLVTRSARGDSADSNLAIDLLRQTIWRLNEGAAVPPGEQSRQLSTLWGRFQLAGGGRRVQASAAALSPTRARRAMEMLQQIEALLVQLSRSAVNPAQHRRQLSVEKLLSAVRRAKSVLARVR